MPTAAVLAALLMLMAQQPSLAAHDRVLVFARTIASDLQIILGHYCDNEAENRERILELVRSNIDADNAFRYIKGRFDKPNLERRKDEILSLMIEHISLSIAWKLARYKSSTFEIKGHEHKNAKQALVTSEVRTDNRPGKRIIWNLTVEGNETVRIRNVNVESVDFLKTTRDDYLAFVSRDDPDDLIEKLQGRIAKLSENSCE